MTSKPIDTKNELRDINNWWPEPKGYLRTHRESLFDTGELRRNRWGKWVLISKDAKDTQIKIKKRCCYGDESKVGGMCGENIEGMKKITTNEISQVLSTPTKIVYIERLIPLCSAHKDLI